MRDSDTYMAILDEGRDLGLKQGYKAGNIEEVKKLIFRLGQKAYGPPSNAILDEIEAIDDLDRLEAMCERVIDAKNWTELVSEPN